MLKDKGDVEGQPLIFPHAHSPGGWPPFDVHGSCTLGSAWEPAGPHVCVLRPPQGWQVGLFAGQDPLSGESAAAGLQRVHTVNSLPSSNRNQSRLCRVDTGIRHIGRKASHFPQYFFSNSLHWKGPVCRHRVENLPPRRGE